MSRAVGSRARVVSLTNLLASIRCVDRCTTRVCACRRVVTPAVTGGTIWPINPASTTVVAAMPRGIAVVGMSAIVGGTTSPVHIPRTPTPSTTAAAHQRTDCDPRAKTDHARGCHVSSAVTRWVIGRSKNNCRVIFRDIDDLRIRRLNHYGLWRLLHDRDL